MALLDIFAVQHSVIARPAFKRWWTTIIAASIERRTYALFANLVLILLFWQWRPMGAAIWNVADSPIAYLMCGLCALGWITVFISTCLIDHIERFGLRQVTFYLRGKTDSDLPFRMPLFYKRAHAAAR